VENTFPIHEFFVSLFALSVALEYVPKRAFSGVCVGSWGGFAAVAAALHER
jgi:hypothetical protein